MKVEVSRAAYLVAAALIVTAVTQLIYVLLSGGGNSSVAYPIWRIETMSAMVVALFSFALVQRSALIAGCLVVCGVFNVIQTGMGLTMFYQLGYGGEAPPNPVFFPVLRMSFFLYFAAKVALGVAGVLLGAQLWRSNTAGFWRLYGALAALAGLIALALNSGAMLLGLGVVPYAGAAGVVAAVLTAIALVKSVRNI